MELNKWTSKGDGTIDTNDSAQQTAPASPVPTGKVSVLDRAELLFAATRPRDILEATPASTTDRHLWRTARLVNEVVSPLGSSVSHVSQDHTLGIRGETVTYVLVDCMKGMPMIANDLVIETRIDVTQDVDNPGAVRARVIVDVGDIKLPVMLRLLKGRVKKAVRANGVIQVNKWLDEMVKAEGLRT